MRPVLKALTTLTAVLGPVATLIGLVQSQGWLVIIGAIVVCISVACFVYAQSLRRRIQSASVEIEGISIDSLNAANLRRRTNRNLTIQTVDHIVEIDGSDLDLIWRYAGFCRAERETAMEFSVDCENNIPFDKLDCYAYDLKRDPDKKSKIQPVLIGPDSISKKIAVPFLEPIHTNQPFDILLHCRLPSTYGPGVAYYTSTLSFDQEKVDVCTVHLTFLGQRPDWVRVYDCDSSGQPQLLKTLPPEREGRGRCEFRDAVRNIEAQSARVYLFRRPEPTQKRAA
jgi:hypothetical protein